MKLASDETITRAERHPNQPRRARIAPEGVPGGTELAVVGRDRRQITHGGSRHAGARGSGQAGDAGISLAGAPGRPLVQRVAAGAGVGVEHE